MQRVWGLGAERDTDVRAFRVRVRWPAFEVFLGAHFTPGTMVLGGIGRREGRTGQVQRNGRTERGMLDSQQYFTDDVVLGAERFLYLLDLPQEVPLARPMPIEGNLTRIFQTVDHHVVDVEPQPAR